MAFVAALRRAATSSAQLFLRSPSAATGMGSHLAVGLLRPVAVAALPRMAHFSTSAVAQKSSDADVLAVLDDEIKCALLECDDNDNVEEIPENFPFKIHDDEGMNIVTLTRDYQNEKIDVIVSTPSFVTGDNPDDDQEADDAKDDEAEEDESSVQSSIPLTVTVSKSSCPSLVFSCTAYLDEIVIDSLSVSEKKEGGGDDEMIDYDGPDFDDLDDKLKNSFTKYLEMRGITPMTTKFLHDYMINKDSKEYLRWLKKVKSCIQQ